jgi:ribosomal protein L37AE/L43A
MSTCPCCGEVLLRHARHAGVYWFCTHCWQEMPTLGLDMTTAYQDVSKPLSSTTMLASRSTLTVWLK